MKLVRAAEEKGVTIPEPFRRTIKILLAPDKEDVPEIMLSHVTIYPGSHTDYHDHDRPELIYVAAGHGVSKCDGEEVEVGPDTALWVPAGEKHEMRNTGSENMILVTVFVPGYTAESGYQACLDRAKEV
jgi:mannose-6-phosphate isomerase-like protein (cupin superfamily)